MHRSLKPSVVVACLVLVLVVTFAVTNRVVTAATLAILSGSSAFPFPFIDDERVTTVAVSAPTSLGLFAVTLVQTLALLALYRLVKRYGLSALSGIAIAVGAVVLTTLALSVPVLTSADVYSYAGYARTSSLHTAYAPIRESLGADFDIVKLKWGNPLDACAYGPLWVSGVRALLAHTASLHDGVMLLRAANVVAFAILLGALGVLRFSGAAIVIVALNPALYSLYVVNAHNDIVAVAALVLGLVALRHKQIALAFVFGCAAALMKIPLLVVAMVVLVPARAPLPRTLYAMALAFVTLLVSAGWGGTAYVHALAAAGGDHARLHGLHAVAMLAAQVFVIVGLLGVGLAAVYRRRYVALGSFTFAGVSSWFRPWYLLWGLPYAVAAGERALALTAVAFPVMYGLSDPWSTQFVPFHLVTLLLTALTTFVLWQLIARRSASATAPAAAA